MRAEAKGITLRIAATFCFALMAACIKGLGAQVPLGQVVFFRSSLALVPLGVFLWASGAFPGGLSTSRPLGHILRCGLGAAAMFTSFATIRNLPLAEATMLSYLAPALMALLGWLLLGEALGPQRLIGVGLGLLGGIVATWPALELADLGQGRPLGIALGLVTALLTAGALIQVRRLTEQGERAGVIALWFAVVSALAGLATLPWGWIWPGPLQLVLLSGAGLAGGVAHILMTLSFRHAEAAALAPFEYLSVLWSVALGALVFAEAPGLAFLWAAPLILAGAVIATPPSRARKGPG